MKVFTERWLVALVIVASTVTAVSNILAESAPTLLNFQGRLTNSIGAPVTSSQSVRFSIIQGGTASESPSTGTVVYQEDATVSPDANGVFVHVSPGEERIPWPSLEFPVSG